MFFLDTHLLSALGADTEPLCWPYFEGCWRLRPFSDSAIGLILAAHMLLLFGTAAALAARKPRAYWVGLLVLNAFLFCVMSLDYRFRANELYMLFWLNFVFLFWPARRWTIPLILISFYFWAGRLKLNYEWLSGSALYNNLWWIPRSLAWLACTYVVCLEMVLIWGLLARRRAITWIVLAQLALFHLESLSQIHWFYPLLMATMLSWFVTDRVVGPPAERPTLQALLRGRAPKAAYGIVALFAAFQLGPLLYPGDFTLTGQGRIFALHMFQARQICDVQATLRYTNAVPEQIDLQMRGLPPRAICDPVVYYSRIENLCRAHADEPGFVDAGLTMRVRRTTDAGYRTVIDEPNFCTGDFRYSVLRENAWLK